MPGMIEFGPKEVLQILDVTDGIFLHREAVRIPLWNQGEGSVLLVSDGTMLEITAPGEGDFSNWLKGLPKTISALDISRVARTDR